MSANNSFAVELLLNKFQSFNFTVCYQLQLYVHYILDDWRVDGYRWFQYETKLIPIRGPVFRNIHCAVVLPHGHDKRLKRQAFFLLDAKQPWKAVLLHYLGGESVVINIPHGNAKSD